MKFSFRTKVIGTILLSCLICTAAAIIVARHRIQDASYEGLKEKATAILSRLEVGRDYISDMGTLKGIIQETKQLYPDGHVPEEQKLKILKSVPVFAAFKLGQNGAEKEHYQFRIASTNPRNKENKANAEEAAILERFRADTRLEEIVQETPDGKSILVARPVRIAENLGCLNCHGHPSKSPWGNGKDILGYDMEDMKEGDMKGMFAVTSSLDNAKAEVQAATNQIIGWGALFTLIAVIIAIFVLRGPLGRINQVAVSLGAAGQEVSSASNQISSVSSALSSSASEGAASLEQTVASIEELSSMVSKNAESAKQAATLAEEAHNFAQKGTEEMGALIKAMSEITTSSKKIEEIISVIDDLAFQTNLLALNAAVEAARAGEQGKGFAVVAEAVRTLAQRSANSAKDIANLINTSVQQVEGGSKIAANNGTVLNNIVSSIEKVTHLNGEIAAASGEQSTGIQQISKAMNQLDQTTQQNAASAEEGAASSEELAAQATTLMQLVVDLNETLNGHHREEVVTVKRDSDEDNTFMGDDEPVQKITPMKLKKPMRNGHSSMHAS